MESTPAIFETWRDLVPADFADDSRVWIYQCNRMLRMQEALQAESLIEDFVQNWKSHGAPVKGYGNLFFGQFLVLMADERATGVSGCSTDSSVRMVKEMEKLFGVQMFDRMTMAFLVKGKVEMLPLHHLQYAIDKGFITPETIYFNNLAQTKKDWLENWMVPVRNSWLASRYQTMA
ncbi:MAG: hypothetical protein MUF29_02950 [Chitinophagaceae bacterium]|jgi:hypothetical protein|nr:hypothetical protein [Chitinophagaceae bacterium]